MKWEIFFFYLFERQQYLFVVNKRNKCHTYNEYEQNKNERKKYWKHPILDGKINP